MKLSSTKDKMKKFQRLENSLCGHAGWYEATGKTFLMVQPQIRCEKCEIDVVIFKEFQLR